MKKTELKKYLKKEYSAQIKKAENWIAYYEKKNKDKKIDWPKVFSKYLKDTVSISKASEDILLGKYSKKDRPKKGDFFNLSAIKHFQDWIVELQFKYVMLNRRTHAILNPWLKMKKSDLDQVVDSIMSKELSKALKRDYLPPRIKVTDVKKHTGIFEK